MAIDLNLISTIAKVTGDVVLAGGIVWGVIKTWPLLSRQKDLVHDRRVALEQAQIEREKRQLAEDRALLERERRRLAEDRATMLEKINETLRISNDGWKTTIDQLSTKVAELNHKLGVAVKYLQQLVLWGRDRRTTEPMPPIPAELEDDINQGLGQL